MLFEIFALGSGGLALVMLVIMVATRTSKMARAAEERPGSHPK